MCSAAEWKSSLLISRLFVRLPSECQQPMEGKMITEDRTFKGRKISLDGGSFYSCEFDECTLVYSGYLPVILDGCNFNDCKWEFHGPALNTVGFMKTLYAGGATKLIENIFGQIRGEEAGSGPILH